MRVSITGSENVWERRDSAWSVRTVLPHCCKTTRSRRCKPKSGSRRYAAAPRWPGDRSPDRRAGLPEEPAFPGTASAPDSGGQGQAPGVVRYRLHRPPGRRLWTPTTHRPPLAHGPPRRTTSDPVRRGEGRSPHTAGATARAAARRRPWPSRGALHAASRTGPVFAAAVEDVSLGVGVDMGATQRRRDCRAGGGAHREQLRRARRAPPGDPRTSRVRGSPHGTDVDEAQRLHTRRTRRGRDERHQQPCDDERKSGAHVTKATRLGGGELRPGPS